MDIAKELSKKLDIINLFPGILIISELLILEYIKLENLQNEFFKTTFILVLAYTVGLVSNILSRLIIDFLSENTTRCLFFGWFAHIDLEDADRCLASDENYLYDSKKENKRRRFSDKIRKWNSIYRAVINDAATDPEIIKRRDQGRLVRNLLFPLILGFLIIFDTSEMNILVIILGVFICILIILILYSYAELTNFAEANDIVRKEKK